MAALLSSSVARCRTKLPIMVASIYRWNFVYVLQREHRSRTQQIFYPSRSWLLCFAVIETSFLSRQTGKFIRFIISSNPKSLLREHRKSFLSGSLAYQSSSIDFQRRLLLQVLKISFSKLLKITFLSTHDFRYETRLNHRFMCDTSHDMDIIGDVISRGMRSRHPFVSRNTRRAHWSRRARHSPKKNYLCIANISNHDADAGHVILQLQQKRSRSERRLSAFPALFAGTYPPGI